MEVKSTTASGVVFTSEAVVSKPGEFATTRARLEILFLSLTQRRAVVTIFLLFAASALIKAEGASGAFKVDKLQIGTDRKIAGEFSLAEAFPGTKLTFK